MKHNKISAKRIALCGVLCAAALIIFVVESQIPVPVPIPGAKLGLANIIILFALLYLSPAETFMILVSRIILSSVFAGQPITLLYSLSGGLLCLAGEVLLIKLFGKKFICEISICGAILHNTGQVFCAAAVAQTWAVFSYLPILIVCGSISGAFCGLCILFMHRICGGKIEKMLL